MDDKIIKSVFQKVSLMQLLIEACCLKEWVVLTSAIKFALNSLQIILCLEIVFILMKLIGI